MPTPHQFLFPLILAAVLAGPARAAGPDDDEGFGHTGFYFGVGGAAGLELFEDALEDIANDEGVNLSVEQSWAINARAGYRLASWVALCPGNHQTGGKQHTGTTRHGNRWARRAFTEAAWAAKNTRRTYAAAQFRRLAPRRGAKRAVVAVAHGLLVAAYYIIQDEVIYRDLGPDHFDRLAPTQLTRYLVKRLERLGHKVILEAAA